jgi:parvulin-like peptidyl-prolyl isomerase
VDGLGLRAVGTVKPMPIARKLAVLAAAAAVCLPVAACGDDDVDQARKDVQEQADKLKGNLDDLSKDDLENSLNDVEDAAKNGSKDTKREARQLQRKIERELNSRD